MTKVLRIESHRIGSLEGSKRGPSHLAALSLVGSITFLPANHYDDSEPQHFVTNYFTQLPWIIIAIGLTLPGIRARRRSVDRDVEAQP
jgi:hypothetical protein